VGTIFTRRAFTEIGGLNKTNLAKLSTTGTGAANPTWSPNPIGSRVVTLALSGNDLYVGGNFTGIGGQNRTNLVTIHVIRTHIGAQKLIASVHPIVPILIASRVVLSGRIGSNCDKGPLACDLPKSR